MDLTNDDVRDILELLDSLPYDEMSLRTARFALTLRRTPDGTWTQETDSGAVEARTGPTPAGAVTDPVTGHPATGDTAARRGPDAVRAPLPGTFYRAPHPGAAPYVEVGDPVDEDTVVGIVETMKLMNPVYAGLHGTVVEICVADAQFAEQDAALVRVDPARGEATGGGVREVADG